jgi:hypothetical protein
MEKYLKYKKKYQELQESDKYEQIPIEQKQSQKKGIKTVLKRSLGGAAPPTILRPPTQPQIDSTNMANAFITLLDTNKLFYVGDHNKYFRICRLIRLIQYLCYLTCQRTLVPGQPNPPHNPINRLVPMVIKFNGLYQLLLVFIPHDQSLSDVNIHLSFMIKASNYDDHTFMRRRSYQPHITTYYHDTSRNGGTAIHQQKIWFTWCINNSASIADGDIKFIAGIVPQIPTPRANAKPFSDPGQITNAVVPPQCRNASLVNVFLRSGHNLQNDIGLCPGANSLLKVLHEYNDNAAQWKDYIWGGENTGYRNYYEITKVDTVNVRMQAFSIMLIIIYVDYLVFEANLPPPGPINAANPTGYLANSENDIIYRLRNQISIDTFGNGVNPYNNIFPFNNTVRGPTNITGNFIKVVRDIITCLRDNYLTGLPAFRQLLNINAFTNGVAQTSKPNMNQIITCVREYCNEFLHVIPE